MNDTTTTDSQSAAAATPLAVAPGSAPVSEAELSDLRRDKERLDFLEGRLRELEEPGVREINFVMESEDKDFRATIDAARATERRPAPNIGDDQRAAERVRILSMKNQIVSGEGCSLGLAPGSDSGLAARSNAYRIARLACDEQQPMPSEGVDNRLIAEACEDIGEVYAKSILWFECATARRMACWYWRKALDE